MLKKIQKKLQKFNQQWYITVEPKQASKYENSTESVTQALQQNIPNLFILSKQKESGIISVRLLRKQAVQVKVAQMNSEAVKSIWGNLVFELLYLTNDDDGKVFSFFFVK